LSEGNVGCAGCIDAALACNHLAADNKKEKKVVLPSFAVFYKFSQHACMDSLHVIESCLLIFKG
jgi:hypothetical protein